MSTLLVVGEDSLCCALAERMVASAMPRWTLSLPPIDKEGVTKLRSALPRYAEQALHVQPVFCLADTDGQCAVEWLHQWRPSHAPTSLLVRLAVNEAEGWVLADRSAFARHMNVPSGKIPARVDELIDPKAVVLQLIGRSKSRRLRTEMISASDPTKQGTGYNLHLCHFVRNHWDCDRARELSPSLDRALRSLQSLALSRKSAG